MSTLRNFSRRGLISLAATISTTAALVACSPAPPPVLPEWAAAAPTPVEVPQQRNDIPTLRELVGVNTDSGLGARLQEQDIAAGMTGIEKSWKFRSLGKEINELIAEEARLRSSGDIARADMHRQSVGELLRRQTLYAPK